MKPEEFSVYPGQKWNNVKLVSTARITILFVWEVLLSWLWVFLFGSNINPNEDYNDWGLIRITVSDLPQQDIPEQSLSKMSLHQELSREPQPLAFGPEPRMLH